MIKAVDIDGSDSRRCDEILVRRFFLFVITKSKHFERQPYGALWLVARNCSQEISLSKNALMQAFIALPNQEVGVYAKSNKRLLCCLKTGVCDSDKKKERKMPLNCREKAAMQTGCTMNSCILCFEVAFRR